MRIFKNPPDPGKINLKERNGQLRAMLIKLLKRLKEQDRELAALREELAQFRDRDDRIIENAQAAIEKIEIFNSNRKRSK